MKSLKITNQILVILFVLIFIPKLNAQYKKTVVSEKWRFGYTGSPVFYKTKSISDSLQNVYIVGATINSLNNRDLIIQKVSSSGTLIWEKIISGDANLDDVGSDVFIDEQLNVYVTGTVNNIGTNEDFVVYKYSSSGNLVWSYVYNSTDQDGGTALIKKDTNVFVTGVTVSTSTLSDFLTLSINDSTGLLQWSNVYNYADFQDVAVSLVADNSYVYVTGGSQNGPVNPAIKWEMAIVSYQIGNGLLDNEQRATGNGVNGIDEVHDIIIDNMNDIYIVGGVVNQSTNLDIAIFKLDANLNLIWEQYFDGYGFDDVAYGAKLDSIGNIYLTGYTTKNGEGKNIVVKKIDNVGSEIWSREINGQASQDDFGVQLAIYNDTTIFITGAIRDNSYSDFILAGINASGEFVTVMKYNGDYDLEDIPTSLTIDLNGNIVLTGQSLTNSGYKTKTIKYSVYLRNMQYNYDSIEPVSIKNNVIIRFAKESVYSNVYSNKNIVAGTVASFVNGNDLITMSAKTGFSWDGLMAYRIHTEFGPADSLSVTRYGDTISTHDFWTSLVIETPKGYSEKTIIDSLLTLENIIINCAENNLYFGLSAPDDTYYSYQKSLFVNSTYPNSDINVEDAWDLEVGSENIKVGVVDYTVNYCHEDFGDGTYLGSKVKGYDCISNINLPAFGILSNSSHGTSVAGIIGALRNNDKGVAGIAGGDMSDVNNLNTGVQLYNLVIFPNDLSSGALNEDVIQAVTKGNLQTTVGNGYGLHIQNFSFGSDYANGELWAVLNEGFKNGVVYVAGRGNNGLTDNKNQFPACYVKDNVIMNVIASGIDGDRKDFFNGDNLPVSWASSYGWACSVGNCVDCENVDFMAPGANDLILTTYSPNTTAYNFGVCSVVNDDYNCFNGTSAAAPHVSGVAALMMSKHQISNGYLNGLISEDIERIMEKNTYDPTPGFDFDSGYGLIDANKALIQVSDPYYVKHVVVPVTTYTNLGIVNGGANEYVAPNPYGVPSGNYNYATKYICYWNQTHNLPPSHEIIDSWKLEARTQLGMASLSNPNFNGTPTTVINNENLTANIGGGTSSIYGSTHIYKLTNFIGQEFWYPASPENMKYVYSLHVEKQPDASIDELSNESISIYPNPTNSAITVGFDRIIEDNYIVEIIDAIGKKVISKEISGNSIENISVSNLKSGVYFCKIVFNNKSLTKTFIKLD